MVLGTEIQKTQIRGRFENLILGDFPKSYFQVLSFRKNHFVHSLKNLFLSENENPKFLAKSLLAQIPLGQTYKKFGEMTKNRIEEPPQESVVATQLFVELFGVSLCAG